VLGKVSNKLVIGMEPGLRKAGNSFDYSGKSTKEP